MKNVSVLGSTGSIGKQTLEVALYRQDENPCRRSGSFGSGYVQRS